MPDLNFQVDSAEAVTHAANPMLTLKLRVTNTDAAEPIHGAMLQCQIRIDPARRRYQPAEQERLSDLFGEPSRWGQTLRPMLWTHATVLIPPFVGNVVVDLHLPCTFDFTLAATKYFHGLENGDVPLLVLVSGTVFFPGPQGALQIAQVPWSKEATFRLPVQVWKETIEHYYPNTAWLCLRRDVFDRLHQYRTERGIPTWEAALESLLPSQSQKASP